jgi:catechol 2,3-dioxygenase-like lactoylglutathione lyase family enzyme
MTVTDVDRTAAFFTDVLAFEKVRDVAVSGTAYERLWSLPGARARIVRLRLGREEVELTEYLTPKGRPFPSDARSNDRSFQHLAIVVSDMDAAHARLVAHGVRGVSRAPQVLPASNVAVAGIAAFYFRDPDGHTLELIHFPAGKGDPRWQTRDGRLFLGIDHTAIGVRDTAASLAFYRDRLGMEVVGASLNVGTEQEHLTAVPGARVRITSLRTPAGPPGIELLEYEAPRDGRAAPPDTRANDVVHWRSTLAVGALEPTARALRDADVRFVSPEVVDLGGSTRAVLVTDPDGHAVELVGP